jgi:hypothetical protein
MDYGPLLLRTDTGVPMTEADLMIGGSSQRFVVWDESADGPVVYDPSSGSFDKPSVRPALSGERRIKIRTGQEILCQPVFAALAALAATYNAARSQAITWVPAVCDRQSNRPSWQSD